jgi:hypothetical protein
MVTPTALRKQNVQHQHQSHPLVTSTSDRSIKRVQPSPLRMYLDKILLSRGYSIKKISSIESNYRSRPTSFQKVSYGTKMAQAVKDNTDDLVSYIKAGISPNPYDSKKHSFLVHTVCNNENYNALRVMLQYGGSEVVQCIDTFGRTPLHCVCWNLSNGFTIDRMNAVKEILRYDSLMINIVDCSSTDPFNLIPDDQLSEWQSFIDENMNDLWPAIDDQGSTVCSQSMKIVVVETRRHEGHDDDSSCVPTRRKPTPLTKPLAKMLSSGRMTVEELNLYNYDDQRTDNEVDTTTTAAFDNTSDDQNTSTEYFAPTSPTRTLSTSTSNSDILDSINSLIESMSNSMSQVLSESFGYDLDSESTNDDDDYEDDENIYGYNEYENDM